MLGGMGWRIVACPVVGVADGGALAEDCGLHWCLGPVPLFPVTLLFPYFPCPLFPLISCTPSFPILPITLPPNTQALVVLCWGLLFSAPIHGLVIDLPLKCFWPVLQAAPEQSV